MRVAQSCEFLLNEQVEFTWKPQGEGWSLCQGNWHSAGTQTSSLGGFGIASSHGRGTGAGNINLPSGLQVNGTSWLGGVKGRGEKGLLAPNQGVGDGHWPHMKAVNPGKGSFQHLDWWKFSLPMCWGGWNETSFKVPSHPKHSGIFLFCGGGAPKGPQRVQHNTCLSTKHLPTDWTAKKK